MTTPRNATLTLDGQSYEFPVLTGTIGPDEAEPILDRPLQGVDARAMPQGARHSPRLRPTTVAIHDDGHVQRSL